MGKIIKFSNNAQSAEEFIENFKLQSVSDEALCVMCAAKLPDGSWATGWFNADYGTRQEGIGHMQADVIDSMIKANIDRYIEYL